MKKTFGIIQSIPYCSNCGESDWEKNKNGKVYCVYCGHPMLIDKDEKTQFKEKIKKAMGGIK